MTRLITIAFRVRGVEITPEWAGKGLAVHKPVAIDGAGGHPVFREERGRWCITHIHTGLSAGVFKGSLDHAKAFARKWDEAFAAVTTSKLPARLRQDYLAALQTANNGPSRQDIIEAEFRAMTDHCVVDMQRQVMRCEACGTETPLQLSMAATEVARRADQFVALHCHCRPRRKCQEAA